MDKIERERLDTLESFLETLPEDQFYFGSYVLKQVHGCASIACALGWTPKLFPELVTWELRPGSMGGYISSKDTGHIGIVVGTELFGVDLETAEWLFAPGAIHSHFGDNLLENSATAKQVAEHIRKYLRWVDESEFLHS